MDNPTNSSGPVGTPQQQIVEKLKSANNILVTVSNNPSVDQLAAAIGLTILLNKMKKHATAVFSGQVPSTIEFLKPEDTIEKNTDSLRDFIIALDKSKADKLRYKVEENIVKIFITPYRTSINENDLEFSQGDFNVDVVLALGVHEQKDLDQAITAHGRILHDAVVISVNLSNASELGAINWTDPTASSLSELAVEITDSLGRDLVDAQIATALLTGIVAETDRFSNEKTSPNTMKLAAELMTAGANQQLVASELQATTLNENTTADVPQDQTPPPPAKSRDDGTLEITHAPAEDGQSPLPPDDKDDNQPPQSPGGISDVKQTALDADSSEKPDDAESPQGRGIMTEAPSLGGMLTANTVPEDADESSDVLGLSAEGTGMPLLERDKPADQASTKAKPIEPPAEPDLPLPTPVGLNESPATGQAPPESIGNTSALGDFQPLESEPPAAPASPAPPAAEPPATPPSPAAPSNQIHIDADGNLQLPGTPPAAATPVDDNAKPSDEPDTLSDLEQSVHSPHLGSQPNVDSARNAVMDAINNVPPTASSLPPKEDLGATGYLNVQDLPTSADTPAPAGTANEPAPGASTSPADTPLDMPLPPGLSIPPANPMPPTSVANDPSAPPPVPPPMTELPPFSPPK